MDNDQRQSFFDLLIEKSNNSKTHEIIKIDDSMTKEEKFKIIDENFNTLIQMAKDKLVKDMISKYFYSMGSLEKDLSYIVGEGGPEIDNIYISEKYVIPEDSVKEDSVKLVVLEKSKKREQSSKEKILNILNFPLNEEERFMAENNPEMFLQKKEKTKKDLNRIKYSAKDGQKTFEFFLKNGEIKK